MQFSAHKYKWLYNILKWFCNAIFYITHTVPWKQVKENAVVKDYDPIIPVDDGDTHTSHNRMKRKVVTSDEYLWPNASITYTFQGTLWKFYVFFSKFSFSFSFHIPQRNIKGNTCIYLVCNDIERYTISFIRFSSHASTLHVLEENAQLSE